MVDLAKMHDYDNLLYKIARKLAYFEIYGQFLVGDEMDNKPHATSIWGSNRGGSFLPIQQPVFRNDFVRYENRVPTELTPNKAVPEEKSLVWDESFFKKVVINDVVKAKCQICGTKMSAEAAGGKLFPLSDSAARNVDPIPKNEFHNNGSCREEDDEGYYELLDAFKPPAPRPGYVCNICRIPGHFIQYCPQAPTKTRTPYQGSKQCIGLFICNKCKRQWKSNKSFAEAGQECKKCRVIINPKKQFPLYTPPRKARADSFAYGSGDVNGPMTAANEYFSPLSSPSPPLSSSPNIIRNDRNEISSSATSSPPAGALRTQSLTANLIGRKVRFDSVMTTTASLMSDVFCDSALATPSPSPFGAYEFVFDC